jgi:putative tricarboxylic transport membrane protein
MNGVRPVVRNAAPYTVLLLVAIYFFHHALGISVTQANQLGPGFWPEAALVLLMLTCSVAILDQIRKLLWPQTNGGEKTVGANSFSAEKQGGLAQIAKIYPWIAISLTMAYVYLFPRIGYFLATSLFVTAAIYLGNYRRIWVAGFLGIGASVVFMFVFMKIVYVSLPIGTGPFADISTFVMAALGIR